MTRHLRIATAIIGKTTSQWWAEDKHRSGYRAMAAFVMAKPITFCDSALPEMDSRPKTKSSRT